MTIDFKKCRVSKSGNIISAKARMSFPYLFEARPGKNGGKAKFQLSLLFPPDADLSLLKAAVDEKIKEKYGDKVPAKLKKPFLKAWEQNGMEDFDGWILIRTSAVTKPGIVNAKGENVTESSEVYPGRWCSASLRAYDYDVDGNRGISFGLQNVQILDHDEPLGGRARAEDEFEPVDAPAGQKGKSADSLFDE